MSNFAEELRKEWTSPLTPKEWKEFFGDWKQDLGREIQDQTETISRQAETISRQAAEAEYRFRRDKLRLRRNLERRFGFSPRTATLLQKIDSFSDARRFDDLYDALDVAEVEAAFEANR